ncbi:MAG: heme-dependent oxidative N-demethylase subunit alpha family protein [Pseudomonadales bacterium]|nr:heme-dependent oxidative N-demethylase subunit alpha family protein [Pseudomonadales bacterium]
MSAPCAPVEDLAFLPWRSARGPVHGALRMGLAPIPEADWLPEPPDRDARLAARRTVLSAHPEQAHACPDAARPAAEEALALVAAHRGVDAPEAASPLLAAGTLVVDDLCLLEPGASGRLRAGLVTAPSGWRLDRRLGRDLRGLHGPVEDLEARLGARMRTFLERLAPGRIFERGNWFLYDDDRPWRPDDDALGRVPRVLDEAPAVADHLWLRMERQTLRRLPRTGWLLFTIRPHFLPVHALATEPAAAADLATVIEGLDATERRLRRLDRVGPGLLRFLHAAAGARRGIAS